MSPIRLHQLHRIIRRDDRLHLPALNLGKVRREKQVAHLELPNKRMGIIWSVHEQIVGENVRKPSSKCGRVVRVRDGVEEGVGRGVRSRAEDAEDGSGRPSAGFVVAGGYPEVEVDLKRTRVVKLTSEQISPSSGWTYTLLMATSMKGAPLVLKAKAERSYSTLRLIISFRSLSHMNGIPSLTCVKTAEALSKLGLARR